MVRSHFFYTDYCGKAQAAYDDIQKLKSSMVLPQDLIDRICADLQAAYADVIEYNDVEDLHAIWNEIAEIAEEEVSKKNSKLLSFELQSDPLHAREYLLFYCKTDAEWLLEFIKSNFPIYTEKVKTYILFL
jgi:hypothetical protein